MGTKKAQKKKQKPIDQGQKKATKKGKKKK